MTAREASKLSDSPLYLEHPFRVCEDWLEWQKSGLSQTASGYGNRLTTVYKVAIGDSKVWRRVYAICYSNVASYYVQVQGTRLFIRDADLDLAREQSEKQYATVQS